MMHHLLNPQYWTDSAVDLFIFWFYVAFNTVQVISRRVLGRAEKTSTYSSSGFCTVNCRPTASNYQLSHLRPCREATPASEVGGECYHSATVAPTLRWKYRTSVLCHQHLCCVAYRDSFIISFCSVSVSSSHFLFHTVSQKWLDKLNSKLACGCNWSSCCAV